MAFDPIECPKKNTLCDPAVEMQLLSCAMRYPKLWRDCAFLKPYDFTNAMAACVWEQIGFCVIENKKPDPRLIASAICKNEDDRKLWTNNLIDWVASVVTTWGAEDYGRHIKDLSDRRRLVASSEKLIDLAKDTSCGQSASDLAARASADFLDYGSDANDFISLYDIGQKLLENLKTEIPCYGTGFRQLDDALGGGFYKGRFYGIGGRMKAGKSMLMSSIAYNMALNKKSRNLYICLEMGAEEIGSRILSSHMGINSLKFIQKEYRCQEWFERRLRESTESMKAGGLTFKSRPRMHIDDLKTVIARAGMSGKFDGIIVDYIQLVDGKRREQSSAEHYDNVAQTLAEAVKRYPVWILSAAQLNRDGNIRGSDGLLMACDLALSLQKIEGSIICTDRGDEKQPDRAWLETIVSRYTPYMDCGSETNPGFEIDLRAGPRFVEL